MDVYEAYMIPTMSMRRIVAWQFIIGIPISCARIISAPFTECNEAAEALQFVLSYLYTTQRMSPCTLQQLDGTTVCGKDIHFQSGNNVIRTYSSDIPNKQV